ncbi:hypothetical protein M8J75_000389 [Diaphorina citri]|nr:hypothetical protein M8J75_000389 [Diaphorina citri]
MSRNCFHYILNKIAEDLTKQNTTFREAITPQEKLAVTLRFLATGDSYRTIAFNYRLGHSTVQTIVQDVCIAIIANLKAESLPTPTKEKWKEIANEFWNLWNFPHCLGALDGKHIKIVAPANSGSNYFNYKHTFSVVDIGSYGKNSDGGIFASSALGKALNNGTLNIPEDKNLPGINTKAPYVIIGDSAFPLKKNLMRPYPEPQSMEDVEKRIFNYRLCRARRVVENAFGILSQKFRIYLRTLNSKPGNVENIIMTTIILHNMMRKYVLSSAGNSDELPSYSAEDESQVCPLPNQGGCASKDAFQTREIFKQFFNSDAGKVPWQMEKV